MDEILLSDATDQLDALRAGRVSAQELLQAALDRTNRLDGTVKATGLAVFYFSVALGRTLISLRFSVA